MEGQHLMGQTPKNMLGNGTYASVRLHPLEASESVFHHKRLKASVAIAWSTLEVYIVWRTPT